MLSSGLMFAQPGRGPRDFGGAPPDPATMVQMRVNHLATTVNLTDAQKAQATSIFTNAVTAEQSIHTNLRAAQQNLATAIKNNDSASIDQIAATIGTYQGQLAAANAKAEAAFYAILTADQKANYNPGGGFGGGFRGRPAQQ